MAADANRGGGGLFADINITPLTDIFLVLLIIFMVATSVTIESAARVGLSRAKASAASSKPAGIVVAYTADHRIFVANQSVTLAQLPATLRDGLDQTSDRIVVFQGDPAVDLADTVRILDIAKSAGAEQISVNVAHLSGASGNPQGGAHGGK